MDLSEEDLRINVYDCLVPGPDQYAVRIHHVPTGIVAESAPQASRIQAKEEALVLLREKLGQDSTEGGVMADYARLTVRQLIDQLSGFPPETVVSASFDAGCARGVVSAVEAGKGDGGLDDECDSVVLVVD